MLDFERLSELMRGAARRLGGPSLIFTTTLPGHELLALLERPGVCAHLHDMRAGVAIGLGVLDADTAQAARVLLAADIPTVAWLMLPPESGYALGLRNYPQASEYYHAFQHWARAEDLHFSAIGLEIVAPPDVARLEDLTTRHIIERLWLGRENALYEPARNAFVELFAAIRQDGYEVHTYQLPVIADDRRAGTTLIQRSLDIVDLPADVEVLLCSSNVPFRWLRHDLGGALIASYGPAADAIGIGGIDDEIDDGERNSLPWHAIERDLLLANEYTDTVYVESLEGCVQRDLLPLIARLPWGAPVKPGRLRLLLIQMLRGLAQGVLLVTRFGVQGFAWMGWLLAALLWLRGRRRGQHGT